VNNVLGFPFIFRGALDVDATVINEPMKMAAVHALAELARSGEDDLPDEVRAAYPGQKFDFGPEYIIPKPFDSRAFVRVSSAVAEAAMESGAARRKVDIDHYRQQLFIRAEDMRKR
jgi:malate dehydrogenase (oxaloacetate-decarboxylating)(NADP+)